MRAPGRKATSPAVPVSQGRPPAARPRPLRAYVIGELCHWPARPEEAQACARGGGGARCRKASGRGDEERAGSGRLGELRACAGTRLSGLPQG